MGFTARELDGAWAGSEKFVSDYPQKNVGLGWRDSSCPKGQRLLQRNPV